MDVVVVVVVVVGVCSSIRVHSNLSVLTCVIIVVLLLQTVILA